jgi:hypothetical protein
LSTIGGDGLEVDQLIHARQLGDVASQLGLAVLLHEQVCHRLAAPEGRGLDARRDHGHHGQPIAPLVGEGFREVP